MAKYDFHCLSNTCDRGHEPFEVNLLMADRDRACVRCPDCGSQAKRQVVPSHAPSCVSMKRQELSERQIPGRLLP